MSMLSKFDVSDEFVLTTWSMGLMLSSANGSVELEHISKLDQCLIFLHITDSYSTSNIIFHSNNIIIDFTKVQRQKIHAGLLDTINVRVQVGDLN